MARVAFTNEKEATGKELEAYLELKNQGKLTNMKEALLQDYATYDAFWDGIHHGTDWLKLLDSVQQLFMHILYLQQTDAFCAPYSS